MMIIIIKFNFANASHRTYQVPGAVCGARPVHRYKCTVAARHVSAKDEVCLREEFVSSCGWRRRGPPGVASGQGAPRRATRGDTRARETVTPTRQCERCERRPPASGRVHTAPSDLSERILYVYVILNFSEDFFR